MTTLEYLREALIPEYASLRVTRHSGGAGLRPERVGKIGKQGAPA